MTIYKIKYTKLLIVYIYIYISIYIYKIGLLSYNKKDNNLKNKYPGYSLNKSPCRHHQ